MSRIPRLPLLLALLIALMLTACQQERVDVLGEPEIGFEGEGEIVLGTEAEDEEEVGAATVGEDEVAPSEEAETETVEAGEAGEGEAVTEEEVDQEEADVAGEEMVVEAEDEPTTEETVDSVDETTQPEETSDGEEAVAEEETPEEGFTTHTVQAGDTVFSIATRYNTTAERLRELNDLENNFITVGQQLTVPSETGEPVEPVEEQEAQPTPEPAGPVIHTVQRGEWIYAIARQYGVSPQAIMQANNITNPNVIHAGQQLIIPQE
ncbi:MAG: LysM peptidoglycan-binding domain-containing protein [Chloroflexota bacterium]|nr:LysM peptidoglycan-binding domain-containing protein [Chloroflexota bacterium]